MKTGGSGSREDRLAASDAGAALREALELLDLACEMLREQLRRAHPEASEAEIDEMVIEWHRTRPLDAPGPRRPFTPTSPDV